MKIYFAGNGGGIFPVITPSQKPTCIDIEKKYINLGLNNRLHSFYYTDSLYIWRL